MCVCVCVCVHVLVFVSVHYWLHRKILFFQTPYRLFKSLQCICHWDCDSNKQPIHPP